MQSRTSSLKRISDRVHDRIVASVLGVEGLPLPSDTAIAQAAAEEMQHVPRCDNSACLVREVVNGTARAAQFTQTAGEEAARATIIGVLRGASLAGIELAPVLALASERIVWSSAALGGKLSPSVRGAVAGAVEGAPAKGAERKTLLEVVISTALAAVREIDESQVPEAEREIATVVDC